jgi:N-acetylmuramoyl-L-alanine amidase
MCYLRTAFFLLLVVPPFTFGQNNTCDLVFEEDPDRRVSIGVFDRRKAVYASLNDLASAFNLESYENEEAVKLELRHTTGRLKVSADNPYVVLTDPNDRRSTFQLQGHVLHAAGRYFVPLETFLPLFGRLTGRTCTFDPAQGLITVAAPPSASSGFDINSVSFERKANGLLIRIHATRPLGDSESWLRQDGWLYVTIAEAKADTATINAMKPDDMVKRIVAIQSPTSVQLTFRLSGAVAASEILRDEQSHDLIVSLRTPGAEDSLLLARKKREMREELDAQRSRWKLDVIVIDAGHGGHDTGTIGVGKTREKDITLQIALKIGRLIEKQIKDVRVVYTRKDDRFVELDRRGRIANEADGKLFISVHANSLRKKPSPTRGFEVYLLRPGKTEDAIEIAERENAVIELEEGYKERYQELTEENFILVTMAQSAYLKASEVFADLLQEHMEDQLPIPNRGIRQAGFYVLVGAAMPKVLLETAYLSNHEDERFLKSGKGQDQIASAVVNAIKEYKDEYEKLLKEGIEGGIGELGR